MDLLKNPRIRTRQCIHCGALVLEAIVIDDTLSFERENGDDCPECTAELYPAAKVCLLGEVID